MPGPTRILSSSGSTPGVGWSDFYELDFTAEVPATLTDGTWTDSNGKVWSVENTGTTSVQTISVANGLRRVMSGGGAFYGIQRTAPILGIPFADLGSVLDGDHLSLMFRGAFTANGTNSFGALIENSAKTTGLSAQYAERAGVPAHAGGEKSTPTEWYRTGATYTRVFEVEFSAGPVITVRDGGAWTGEWPEPGAGALVVSRTFAHVSGAVAFTPYGLSTARLGFLSEAGGAGPDSKIYAFKIRKQSNV